MCKIVIKAEEAKEIVSTVSTLASKDAVLEMKIGVGTTKDGNLITNCITVIDKTEQLTKQFFTAKPADFEEGKMYMHLVFKAADFCNLAGALVGDSDIYICDSDKGTFIGVDKVSQLAVKQIDKTAVPDMIVLNPAECMLQIKAEVPAFTECLKIGSTMVDPNNNVQGIQNSVLSVSFDSGEGKELAGVLKCYSTNGYAFTRGIAKVKVANKPQQMELLNQYLQGKSSIKIPVPKKALSNLLKLLAGSPDCMLAFSAKHVYVAIGLTTMYAFTMGSEASAIYDQVDTWDAKTKNNTIVVDADDLKEQVSLLDKVIDLSGTKSPIVLNIESGKDLVINTENGAGIAKVKVVAAGLNDKIKIAFNTKLFLSAVNALKKGNVRLSSLVLQNGAALADSPFEISNGTVDANAENSGIAFVLPVKLGASSKPSKPEKAKEEQPAAAKEEPKEEPKAEETATADADLPTTEEVTTQTAETPATDTVAEEVATQTEEGMETVSDTEDVPFED